MEGGKAQRRAGGGRGAVSSALGLELSGEAQEEAEQGLRRGRGVGGEEDGQDREEEAEVQRAEGHGVGGPDAVGPGERDEDGGERGGGAREAARGGLRPPEEQAREAREAVERGVDVARGEHLAEGLRRRGLRGEQRGERVLLGKRRLRRDQRRQGGGEADPEDSCDGGGGYRSLRVAVWDVE